VIVIMIHRRTLIAGALPALTLLGLRTSSGRGNEAAAPILAQDASAADWPVKLAQAHTDKSGGGDTVKPTPAQEAEPSPEERMRRRFPQPVRVGFLVGLPVLDWQDSTIGYVQEVVRTSAGKIHLVVPFGGWFGRGGRPVAVPIETVAILARQIAALDWGREQFAAAPTWTGAGGEAIGPNETIRIALTRR
jgi:hypothetical protein